MANFVNNHSREYIAGHRASLSPYRTFLSMQRNLFRDVLARVRWDLQGESRRSRRRLVSEFGRHAGETAVIVCNGPSLLRTDWGLLRGKYCFGLNKINLIYDKTDFRPNCIVAINRFVIEQNAEFFNTTDTPLYLSHGATDIIAARDNVSFMHMVNSHKFARDVSVSVNEGATVTFAALQLAFHLGFRRIGLIGCDHNFAVAGPANATVTSKSKDESHFDPNYFGPGVQWQLPDLEASEMAYRLAKGTYDAFGGEVVNCTEGGKLEIFRRDSLENFLGAQTP